MKLDSLVRAVSAADFSVFWEIALLYLDKRGFAPSLTDGPHDAGADFLVYVLPPLTTKFVVQISVEKDWKKKVRGEAEKARKLLDADDLLFLSARVITPEHFQEIADELRRHLGIQVQKADAKDIASLAELRGFTNEVLRRLGIDVPPPAPRPFERSDLRRDVAYACGRLSGKNGTVALDTVANDTWASVSALQERERAALGAEVDALLKPHVKRKASGCVSRSRASGLANSSLTHRADANVDVLCRSVKAAL